MRFFEQRGNKKDEKTLNRIVQLKTKYNGGILPFITLLRTEHFQSFGEAALW